METVTWASGAPCATCIQRPAEQRCWNHKILNVLDKLPKREHAQAKLVLCHIPYAETRNEGERLEFSFLTWCHQRGHQVAAEALERDWPNGDLLRFLRGALAALEDYEPGGATLCRPEA